LIVSPSPEAREVRERPVGGRFPVLVHPEWEERFRGVRCGITAAGPGADFGITTAGSVPSFLERYRDLAAQLGFGAVAVPRQVHGVRVLEVGWRQVASGAGASVVVPGEADGVFSARRGVLLAVTAADCVPVYLASPEQRVLALLHAGWRGVAGGVLEEGLSSLRTRYGTRPEHLYLHLGPAICGTCYEVGPEVMEALGRPRTRAPLDLRGELFRRATGAGVRSDRVTRSAWCTACDGDRFHSHRGSGGTAGRMAAFLGSTSGGREAAAEGRAGS
jgi:polyphenol oxidase